MYLDVDGAHRPAAGACLRAFEHLADELRGRARSREDQRLLRSVEGDIARMRAWLAGGIDRSRVRGVALFSCHDQGWFEAMELSMPVRDEVAIDPSPRIRQLVELLDRREPFVTAVVDRGRVRIVRVEGSNVEERAVPMPQRERAASGERDRPRTETVHAEFRRAAAAVDDIVWIRPVRQVVLGGPEDGVAALERALAPSTRRLVAGRVALPAGAPLDDVVIAARHVVAAAERRREAGLVEQMRQRAAQEKGAVVGLEATLAALAENRVATLLVSGDFAAPGASCPSCGHVGPDLRQCPECGTTNVEREDVVELAIERAVAQDADVEICHGTDLDRFGKIAAIERY
ncbi:MAG TPA: hypothetical protein VFJ85_19165 [Acidimicrobiales bacterium]|nr:hypothetical protein [Acidimicrobiales bacterium]